jgi:hypothetical protein
MTTANPPSDPAAFIESLNPQTIREQLAELDRQARALRVLLRSALARQRAAARRDNRTMQQESFPCRHA